MDPLHDDHAAAAMEAEGGPPHPAEAGVSYDELEAAADHADRVATEAAAAAARARAAAHRHLAERGIHFRVDPADPARATVLWYDPAAGKVVAAPARSTAARVIPANPPEAPPRAAGGA